MGRLRWRVSKESPVGEQTIEEVGAAEREWIDANLDAAAELVQVATGVDAKPLPGLELLDQAFEAWLEGWYSRPEGERDDPNPYINAFGIAFGESLVNGLGLEWKMVTDADGTEIAVHGQPGDVLVFPPNLVAKRFVARETRFMRQIYDEVAWTLDRLRRGENPFV